MVANLVVNDNIREVDVSQDEGACLAHVSLTSSKGKLLVFQLDTDNCYARNIQQKYLQMWANPLSLIFARHYRPHSLQSEADGKYRNIFDQTFPL